MRILVVVAHADDEVLGVGGTIAWHVDEGDHISVVIASDCRTARDRSLEPALSSEAEESLAVLGVGGAGSSVDFLGRHGMSLGDGPELALNKDIGGIVAALKPRVVYTHCLEDINSDHRAVAKATLVACRPIGDWLVDRLLHFETPSSSEWGGSFKPNVFVDVSSQMEQKLIALACYKSEVRDAPHPRNAESLRARAAYWGQIAGLRYAEPFELHREIIR
jgi:LmbE family N-acetylglucosaminyl deacetylase